MDLEVRVEVVLKIGADLVPEACAVMHDAFSIYTDRDQPSGALVETPESLIADMDAGRKIAVALLDNRVAAMVKHAPASDGSVYFSRLSVASWAQGQGLPRHLLEALRTDGRTLSCHVRAAESANIALYEHLGMEIVGHERKLSLTGATIDVVRMADTRS